MKIKKGSGHRNYKAITIASIVILLLLLGGLTYAYIQKVWPFASTRSSSNSINYGPPTTEQQNATGSTKQSSGSNESSGSDTSPSPTPSTNPDEKPSVSMTITAANQTDGTLYIRTLIETISSSGICTLSMTGPNNAAYSATADVQANPSTSTCKGFNIPVSALTPGTWHIKITYANSSVQASASKDVTLQ